MTRPTITKEIVVELDNKPGMLGKVADAVAREKVNILGFESQAMGQKGTIHLITTDPEKASSAIKKAGFQPRTRDIVTIVVPNRPGELARLAMQLGKSGVNIEAGYPVLGATGSDLQIAFSCDDVSSARKALEQ